MNTCTCRHDRAQHGIEPVTADLDGRLVVTDWTEVPGTRCVWDSHPHLNRLEKKGEAAPCGCTEFTPKEAA